MQKYNPIAESEEGLLVSDNGESLYENLYKGLLPQKAGFLREKREREFGNAFKHAFMLLAINPASEERRRVQRDVFAISLLQFLVCERILRERKQGGHKNTTKLLTLFSMETELRDLVRRIADHNTIEWLVVTDQVVSIKA